MDFASLMNRLAVKLMLLETTVKVLEAWPARVTWIFLLTPIPDQHLRAMAMPARVKKLGYSTFRLDVVVSLPMMMSVPLHSWV